MMKTTTPLVAAELSEKLDLLNKLGITVKWKKGIAHLIYEAKPVGRYTRTELVEETFENLFRHIVDHVVFHANSVTRSSNGW